MTKEQFENAAFFKGQQVAWWGREASVYGVDFNSGYVLLRGIEPSDWAFQFGNIELLHPDPLTILREIMRRMNSATGDPTACRLDPDLMEQVKKLFEDEQV